MKITHLEEFRFHVQGFDRHPYLVDLTEYGGFGKCSCPHFQTRLQPKLERGEKLPDGISCKHINHCLILMAREAVRRFLKEGARAGSPHQGQGNSSNTRTYVLRS